MKRDWCNCRVDAKVAEKCKEYFRDNDIYFEPSEAYGLVHFEFRASEEEFDGLNAVIKKELEKKNEVI